MTRVMPAQYRVEDNWIRFPEMNWKPVQIPFGLGIGRVTQGQAKRQPLRVKVEKGIVTRLDVLDHGEWRKILPVFKVEIQIPTLACPLTIDTAVTGVDRAAAQTLVQQGHYLGVRQSGLILLAKIQHSKFREKVRRKSRSEKADSTGNAVGALFLERLFHGNPRGRDAIYRDLGRRTPTTPAPGTKPGFRNRVVRELGVYWISRVAVEPPFQGMGIGSILCDAARQVAKDRMLESGRYVELIRQLPLYRYEKIVNGEADFLTGNSKIFGRDLPFNLRTPFLSRVPVEETGPPNERVVPGCKAYYFSKTGRMVLRSTRKGLLKTGKGGG